MRPPIIFFWCIGIILILGLDFVKDWMTRSYHYRLIDAKQNDTSCKGLFQSPLYWVICLMQIVCILLFCFFLSHKLIGSEYFKSMNFFQELEKYERWNIGLCGILILFVSVVGVIEYHSMGRETEGTMYTLSDSGKFVLFLIILILLVVFIAWHFSANKLRKRTYKKHQTNRSGHRISAVSNSHKSAS